MDTKDIIKATDSTKRLVQDESYYKHIFKKTERVVSVVFYVSNTLQTNKRTETLVSDMLQTAQKAHDAILQSLEARSHLAENEIRSSAHALVALESKLRVAEAAGLLAPAVTHLLSAEIDTVLRGMNKYLKGTAAFDDTDYQLRSLSETKPKVVAEAPARPASTTDNQTPDFDRRERIKTVLEAKGEATIKDIADVITDCSSKTIQRELNALIKDGVVKRQGERRWSRYSIV